MNEKSHTQIQPSGDRRIYNPAAALHTIIEELGSATPWAMLAFCLTQDETRSYGTSNHTSQENGGAPVAPTPRSC